jgi:hypothetical protein
LCDNLHTFQRITVSSNLGPSNSFWTAWHWRRRHCDPLPWQELLAQHTASHHTKSECSETVLHWIGTFAIKDIYFCRHYRSDFEVLFLVIFVNYHLLIYLCSFCLVISAHYDKIKGE